MQYFSSRDTVEMPLFGKKKSDPSESQTKDSCVYFLVILLFYMHMVACLFDVNLSQKEWSRRTVNDYFAVRQDIIQVQGTIYN